MDRESSTKSVASPKAEHPREMDAILQANRRVADRLASIDERLCLTNTRLSGEVLSEGADTQDDVLTEPGLVGLLKSTHSLIFQYCDSIDEWISRIEKVA